MALHHGCELARPIQARCTPMKRSMPFGNMRRFGNNERCQKETDLPNINRLCRLRR
jgi:hypothetical protein